MKKLFKVLLASLLLISLAACSKKEDEDLLTTITNRGTLIVATEEEWPPFTYRDKDNVLMGFDVELAKLIADKLGVDIEYNQAGFNEILAGVDTGRFDIAINGVDYTEERAKSYTFSNPYLYDKAALIVAQDNDEIKDFSYLQDKIGTNSPNSIYADMLMEYGCKKDADFIWADTFQLTVDNLIQGRADASINSMSTISYYLNEMGENAGIKVVATSDTATSKYVIGAPGADKASKSAALINKINEILDELKADGTLQQLSIKYFGYDITSEN